MYYLELELHEETEGFSWFSATYDKDKDYKVYGFVFKYYMVDEELFNLCVEWNRTNIDYDGQLSGIIADYIEDHLQIDNYLVKLLNFLRRRFNAKENNRLFNAI